MGGEEWGERDFSLKQEVVWEKKKINDPLTLPNMSQEEYSSSNNSRVSSTLVRA